MRALTIIRIEPGLITCRLEEEYENYPRLLEYLGTHYHKTGWNSDYDEVYYKET